MKIKIFLIIFLLFLIGIFFIWQGIYLPRNRFEKEKVISIETGQSFLEISKNLEREGLIKNSFYLDFYLILTGNYKKLKSGEYLLSSSMEIPKIAKKLVLGDVIKIKVTIPEGFGLEEIEERLTESGLKSNEKIKDQKAKFFKDEFKFLKDVPDEANLEGFLFPDTYYFSYNVSLDEILRKMFENLDKKLTIDFKNEILKQKKSIFEIIIMASMLEKEVKNFEDKKIVSGILWKRLENNIPLQVDATITYITGKKTTKISKEETQIDSSYNTYKYLGLPLGPICNPGLDSILAAIYPEKSEFWYYLSTLEGETIFSKTLKAHNIAKAKYLR